MNLMQYRASSAHPPGSGAGTRESRGLSDASVSGNSDEYQRTAAVSTTIRRHVGRVIRRASIGYAMVRHLKLTQGFRRYRPSYGSIRSRGRGID